MSVTYTAMRTASDSMTPVCAQTVVRFSRHWRAWSPIDPSTSAPVAGSIGTWPEQNSRPPERTAWLYGPAGAGGAGGGPGGRGRVGRGDGLAVRHGAAFLSEGYGRTLAVRSLAPCAPAPCCPPWPSP